MRMRLVLVGFLLAAHAAPFAQDQTPPTTMIRGRVVLPDTAVRPARPSVSGPLNGSQTLVDRRRVVVYLEPTEILESFPMEPMRARMDQRNEQFSPRVLAITIGSTVDFPNSDVTFHNVFSLSRARAFDLGRYRPGRTGRVRFDRPGVVAVFCDIHSHMSAFVLVFSHPFFAVSDNRGRYTIPDVPPGSYVVSVWSELGRTASRRLSVPERGVVEADFEIGSVDR
jgi:plastocyanin